MDVVMTELGGSWVDDDNDDDDGGEVRLTERGEECGGGG